MRRRFSALSHFPAWLELRHAHQFISRLHHVIFYSGETGEDNWSQARHSGIMSISMVAQRAQTHPKKENANKGSRDKNSASKPGLASVETYRFQYFLTSTCSSTRQSSFGLWLFLLTWLHTLKPLSGHYTPNQPYFCWWEKPDHHTGNSAPYSFGKKCVDSLAFQRFTVLIQEDLKVQPFADEITKATLSPQLFKDTECWSGQDLKPCLEQLAPLFYFAFSRQLFDCSWPGTD